MYNLYVSNLWFCYLFCLCLSFTIKVKKRYVLFEKEVRYFHLSSDRYFDVNIVRSLSISGFTKRCFKAQKKVLFFSVSSDVTKGTKRYLSCSWKRCFQKREKPWQLKVMFSKAGKRYLYRGTQRQFSEKYLFGRRFEI